MSGVITQLLDIAVPRFCLHCNSLLPPNEEFLCNICLNFDLRLDPGILELFCEEKFHHEIISGLVSLASFSHESPLRTIVHSLKYHNNLHAGKFLGRVLAEHFMEVFSDLALDFIIPVPLHRLRLINRGYNQSEEISKGMSKVLGVPMNAKDLKRIRYTETQVSTGSRFERGHNIIGAFKLQNPLKFTGKKLLLVDDVITTGSTVREAAKALKEAAPANIFVASILTA